MVVPKSASRAPTPYPTSGDESAARSQRELLEPGLQQMVVAGLRHPPGTRKMALMDDPGAVRFSLRVEPKNDRDHLAPIRTFRVGVEQPKVCRQVALIIGAHPPAQGRT